MYIKYSFLRTLSLLLPLGIVFCAAPAAAQLRVVTYNTTPTVSDELGTVLAAIGEQTLNGVARPIDILALQEQTSIARDTQAVVDMMNAIYGDGTYARGRLSGSGFTTQGVIYNTETVQLLAERRIGRISSQGNPRHTMRYRMRPVGYGDEADFYIYNSHFKASDTEPDAARRAVEAESNRADADALGENTPIIFLGDLNLYRDIEPAFQALIAPGPAQAFDPVDRAGNWHRNGRYRDLHSQSTTVRGGDGRAGGGLNDRFDFQLVNSALMDGEGFSYFGPAIPNLSTPVEAESYRVFGNDGSHFGSRDLSTGSAEPPELLALLERASDHLPVVVDYQLPARMSVETSSVPERVLADADLQIEVRAGNVAPVQTAVGADELDYRILSGETESFGVALATREATTHQIQLDTSKHGSQSQTLIVEAQSEQVADPVREFTFNYEVVARGQASFSPETFVDQLTIDLGEVTELNRDFTVDVFNLATPEVSTAGVFLVPGADAPQSTLAVPEGLLNANGSSSLFGRIGDSVSGPFSASWSLQVVDEDLPGANRDATRTLQLTVRGQVGVSRRGDFNSDGVVDLSDLDALNENILNRENVERFDLNDDGIVDLDDQLDWLANERKTWVGDADLDGEFDSGDLVQVFVTGQYEDATDSNSTWATGDWNADAEFNSSDLVWAFQQAGYEQGQRAAAVPESRSLAFVLIFAMGVATYRRSHSRTIETSR